MIPNHFPIDHEYPPQALAVKRLDLDLGLDAGWQKTSTAELVREQLKINGYPHSDIPSALLPRLLRLLEQYGQKAALVLNGERIVSVLPPDLPMLGLAVDLGMQRLKACLVDLEHGQVLNVLEQPHTEAALQQDVNELAAQLATLASCKADEIVDAVMVGSPAMLQQVTGMPAQMQAVTLPAGQVGLKVAGQAGVYIPAGVAGPIGADHLAALAAMHAQRGLKSVLALDCGTQIKLSLLHKGRHLAGCAAELHHGLYVLLNEMAIEVDDIDLVLITGGRADLIGQELNDNLHMTPQGGTIQMPNAALQGARDMLLSTVLRGEAESMAEKIQVLELTD